MKQGKGNKEELRGEKLELSSPTVQQQRRKFKGRLTREGGRVSKVLCLSKRDKEAILLRWFRRNQKESSSDYVLMEKFDQEYKRLFGRCPLWYYWNRFYRDHGFVGLRSK